MKNNKTVFVFPGQGSQSVGMMEDLYKNNKIVRNTYEEASDVLAMDLWEITCKGPKEQLNQTINTQPAMLVAGIAAYKAFSEQTDVLPAYFAGHSLGEYTALVASGRLEFTDAVLLARKRAESMQNAVPEGEGAMAAIIGLELDIIKGICSDLSTNISGVWAVNYNAPGQIVVAGNKNAVELACEKLKSAGAKRALILPVSVPSHCPLMQPAADEMKDAFLLTNWSEASSPVIHNCDVEIHNDSASVITALSNQLIKPVRWIETIEFISDKSIDTVIEFGPGKVLAGLNKRINKEINAISLFNTETLKIALDKFIISSK